VKTCRCRDDQEARYRQKLSGPLLDRIDLRLTVPRLTKAELLGASGGEPSAVVRERVVGARDRQRLRYGPLGFACNGDLPGPVARRLAGLSGDAEAFLGRAVEQMALTGRGFDRVVKVARTIADLDGAERVAGEHVAEALSFRTAFEDPGDLRRAG
jgi:magnesium chelatase family protein